MGRHKQIHSFSVIVIFVALGMLGCVLLPLMPVKLKPSGELPSITVSCTMRGASPRAMESAVTAPLEGALSRVAGVKHIRSKSSSGKTSISLDLDPGCDIDKTRFEVSMIVRQCYSALPAAASFPKVSSKAVNKDAAGPFMSYSFNSSLPSNVIYNYIEKHVSPVLKSIPGVASVKLNGATPMQWKIDYDPNKLAELDIRPDEITKSVSALELHDTIEAEKIVLKNIEGSIVRLSDVAAVTHCQEEPTSYFRINGRNTVYLNIVAEPDANQIRLSGKVRDAMNNFDAPDEYEIGLDFDSSEQISTELDTIYIRCGLTVIILLLFIALMTLNLRYLLLICISLFLTLALSIIFYKLTGVEIHLYSLSAITISLNLVIDNIIVVTEQLARGKSLKSFTAILAATLTTVGAMSIIFFFDENTILNLRDFAVVVIINLSVSLLTALFLVPALIDRMGLYLYSRKRGRKRITAKGYRVYNKVLKFIVRWKWIIASVFVVLVGGSVYIFIKYVYQGDYFNRSDAEPVLQINASLPNGATIAQMNDIVSQMESLLSDKEGISQFQTNIYNPRNANISVYFKPDYRSSYPYALKSEVIDRANSIGGGSWSVYGLEDMGFSNYVGESAGNNRIKMTGYNYDNLMKYAGALSDSLQSLKRIPKVNITSEVSYFKENEDEMVMKIDRTKLAKDSLTVGDLYEAIQRETLKNRHIAYVSSENGAEPVTLNGNLNGLDWWQLMNSLIKAGGRYIKLSDYADVDKVAMPIDIIREDQEYLIYLQYDYIGSYKTCERVSKGIVGEFNKTLPSGYKAEILNYSHTEDEDGKKYWLIGFVAVIIFFITAVLFNSLRLPFAVISTIPVSFIGVFLAFYFFSIKFDQGAFASLILLCGITVNAAIYVINEYNNIRKNNRCKSTVQLYNRSLRRRISAIMLTVVSTMLGFIPFLIGSTTESFWFPLAVGTISGLLFSLLAIIFLLPVILIPRNKKKRLRPYAKH